MKSDGQAVFLFGATTFRSCEFFQQFQTDFMPQGLFDESPVHHISPLSTAEFMAGRQHAKPIIFHLGQEAAQDFLPGFFSRLFKFQLEGKAAVKCFIEV